MIPLHEVTSLQLGSYSKFRRAQAIFRSRGSSHQRSAGQIAAMLGHLQEEEQVQPEQQQQTALLCEGALEGEEEEEQQQQQTPPPGAPPAAD